MSMYNLLEYSKNYKKTTGSLSNYYRDQPSSTIGANNITHSILNSESFDHRASFMENGLTHDNLTKNDVKVVAPLKHLSNFWRHLDIPLINCKFELILTWFKNCVLIDKSTREADYGANPVAYEIDNPENAIFKITDVTLFVPVVTLSKENDIKLLEQLKTGFKRTIKWNKYRSRMTIQPQNNNLNYLIDPTFTNANRLFVLSFPRNNNIDSRYSFSNYCVPKVKVNDFNVLVDGKSFFGLSVKNDKEAYEKIIDMSNNSDYTTGNLLNYAYYKKHYRLIAIDLSKQTKLKDPQQINFIAKLFRNTEATMFFIIEKSEETTFNFSQNFVPIVQIMKTQKIVNLLNGSDNDNSKSATKKWFITDSESNDNYSQNDEIKFLNRSIESSLCDYSDPYILVTGNITATPNNAATQLVFKNCAPFEKCRTEINELLSMKQILLILQCLCII